MLVDDFGADRRVNGHRESETVGLEHHGEIRVRQLAAPVEGAAKRLAHAEPHFHSVRERGIHFTARFVGHSESSVA